MKTLIFDIYSTGHHSEYIEHLVNSITYNNANSEMYIFVLNEDFKTKFKHIINIGANCKFIDFLFVTENERTYATSGASISKSFKQLSLVFKYAKKYNAHKILLMHINLFQIALCFKRSNFSITGILLSQFTRQDISNGWKERLRYYRRYFQTYFITKNKNIKKIFLLNDLESCNYLNNQFHTNIFRFLPDPLPNLDISEAIDVAQLYNISDERQIYFHFGSLGARKGTFDILDSLCLIPEIIQRRIAIIIAGKTSSGNDHETILNSIKKLEESGNKVKIIFEHGFISNNLKNNICLQSHVFLMPYKNVESSSGVLSHAIKADKHVIGPQKGLLGDLIASYGKGIILEDDSLQGLAQKMAQFDITKSRINKISAEKFTPESFSNCLLSLHD